MFAFTNLPTNICNIMSRCSTLHRAGCKRLNCSFSPSSRFKLVLLEEECLESFVIVKCDDKSDLEFVEMSHAPLVSSLQWILLPELLKYTPINNINAIR